MPTAIMQQDKMLFSDLNEPAFDFSKQKLALLGNPNCGKTLLFNALTGSNQYVGNWPGVTVEKKSGKLGGGKYGEMIDLPGIYSLSTYSIEERVSLNYLVDEHPDVIINIIDGTNIERNLYLTVQLMELKRPMAIVINMMDEVRKRGDNINCEKLSRLLGVPVIPISAKKRENIEVVISEAKHLAVGKDFHPTIRYDSGTQDALRRIEAILAESVLAGSKVMPLSFYSAKLLEGDAGSVKQLSLSNAQRARVEAVVSAYEKTAEYGDRQTMLADARYQFIERLVEQVVYKKVKKGAYTLSDKIDRIVTNRFLGFPLFFGVLFLMFYLTFETVGATMQEWLALFFDGVLSPWVSSVLDAAAAPAWTYGLLIDGVIAGVGGILSFVPLIALLFFFLSFMEDSGYMARAAFIMDKLFRKIGLSGKSFIPMIMGFGCSVPAVMAARTMESEKDRRLTIMLTPFMSCGAKLPIYALFATAFFSKHQSVVVYSMYLLGMAVAVVAGLILSKTVFKGEATPFVMELPNYHMPSLRSTLKLTWDKAKDFIIRAGTLIFAMTVVLWFLKSFDFRFNMVGDSSLSILGMLGALVAPLLIPLGFGTWQASVSILTGFVAKEAVVSTMALLYGVGQIAAEEGAQNTALLGQIQTMFTPVAAYAFMAFMLLCSPCMAACAAIKREMNSWKWAAATYGFQIGMAYVVAMLIYQIGNLIF